MLLGLNFVMLHVPDIEQARAFYTEKLGFVVEGQQPGFVQFKQNAGMCAIFALQEQAGGSPPQGVELWWLVDNGASTNPTLVSQCGWTASQPTGEPFQRPFDTKEPPERRTT